MNDTEKALRELLKILTEIAAEQKKTREFIETLVRSDAAGNAIRVRVQQ